MSVGSGNRNTAFYLLGVVVVMVGMSFAAVPLYDLFCRVTGYGGTTNVAEAPEDTDIRDEVVSIRFDATVAPDMPWEFRPVERTMDIRIGETGLAFYEAYNPTDQVIAGTASYNVAPYSAGGYFTKIACFCFEMQVLQPGERVEMPVSFYVDPGILEDREAKYVHDITLSYTMHRAEVPEDFSSVSSENQIASASQLVDRPVEQ